MSGRETRASFRANALLSALLLGVVLVFGNRLAEQHLDLRRDLSEDQLYALAPATQQLLNELEDVLVVEAYFTGAPEHAVVQIARRRLLDLLAELQQLAGGRMSVRVRDPNTSTGARIEADALGVEPVPLEGWQGTARVTQDVYLGLVLRYGSRREVLPWVLPQNLEVLFARALPRLTRAQRRVVGLVVGPGEGRSEGDGYQSVRDVLGLQYDVREVVGLAEGQPVPAEIEVLLVLGPQGLHARSAFAIDQYIQSGRSALLCLDPVRVDPARSTLEPLDSGLDGLLAAWGTPLSEELVWDVECNQMRVEGRSFPFPLWPNLGAAGLSREHAATAQLPGADLWWAGAFVAPGAASASGARQSVLLESSEQSWLVPAPRAHAIDPEQLRGQGSELAATRAPQSFRLALALEGRLTSGFEESGAPAPWTFSEQVRIENEERAAREAGLEPPPRSQPRTDEQVRSEESDAHVVLVADADWVRDGSTFSPRNRMLLENLVDWLALEEELMALRSRVPRVRTIRDLAAEARTELGISGLVGASSPSSAGPDIERQARAERLAARRRWLYMGAAAGGSMGLYLLIALGLIIARPRPPESSS